MANLFCTNCGNSVASMSAPCKSCGANPTAHRKYCRHCGVALNPEQIVCVKCNANIEDQATQEVSRNMLFNFVGLVFGGWVLFFGSGLLPLIGLLLIVISIARFLLDLVKLSRK